MKPILPIMLLLSLHAVAQIRKQNVETTVQEVTIYPSGAQVERAAAVAVPAGRSEIIFTDLSNQLQLETVQLKAEGNITLIAVQTIKDYFSQRKIEQEESNLLEKRDELKDKSETDSRLLQVFRNEEQMLIKNEAIGGQTGVKTDELRAALDLHRQRLTEVLQKQLEFEKRIKVYQGEMSKINAQLAEMGKKRDSAKYTVSAIIESKENRNIKFNLSYVVKDAGWYPAYDVRVTNARDSLTVQMNANVFQRSGETWKDVTVQLSSGNPNDNATPTKLETWLLGFNDPSINFRSMQLSPGTISGRIADKNGQPVVGATIMVRNGHIGVTSDANGFFKLQNIPPNSVIVVSAIGYVSRQIQAKPGYFGIVLNESVNNLREVAITGYSGVASSDPDGGQARANRKPDDIQPVAITTQYRSTNIIYRIKEKYSLETDGKTTAISMKKIKVPASFEYFSAPKIDPSVFLTAKVVDWKDYGLQSGEANLYFEGTYLGKTYLDLASASDTLQFSLGKDNNVSISRKLVREFSSKKFLANNKTEARQFEIVVRNNRNSPINLVVQDQFPISVSKEITVDEQTAPDAQIDKETGTIIWNLKLSPFAEKNLRLGYQVKYPKDKKLVLE